MLDQFARLTEKRFRPLKDINEALQTSRHLSEIGYEKKMVSCDSERARNR